MKLNVTVQSFKSVDDDDPIEKFLVRIYIGGEYLRNKGVPAKLRSDGSAPTARNKK